MRYILELIQYRIQMYFSNRKKFKKIRKDDPWIYETHKDE